MGAVTMPSGETSGVDMKRLTWETPREVALYDFVWRWLDWLGSPARLFTLAMVAFVVRAPGLLLHPRFWAEEGTFYFAHAYGHSFWDAITYIPPQIPYYLFLTNLGVALAGRVPIEWAPLITSLFAMVVQFLPVALIVWSRSELFNANARKACGVLLVLLAPSGWELWLTTTGLQFWCALIAALILLDVAGPVGRWGKVISLALLAICGLTGLIACFLTPLFILSALLRRRWLQFAQAAVLIGCCLFHLSILVTHTQGISQNRFSQLDLNTFVSIVWTRALVLPFLGPDIARVLGFGLRTTRSFDAIKLYAITWLLIALGIGAVVLLYRKVERTLTNLLLAGSALMLLVMSVVLALGQKSGLIMYPASSRYFYVPNVLLLMLMLNYVVEPERIKVSCRLRSLILFFAIGMSILYFPSSTLSSPQSPRWSAEAAKWRKDPGYAMEIWPKDWYVRLENQSGGTGRKQESRE